MASIHARLKMQEQAARRRSVVVHVGGPPGSKVVQHADQHQSCSVRAKEMVRLICSFIDSISPIGSLTARIKLHAPRDMGTDRAATHSVTWLYPSSLFSRIYVFFAQGVTLEGGSADVHEYLGTCIKTL